MQQDESERAEGSGVQQGLMALEEQQPLQQQAAEQLVQELEVASELRVEVWVQSLKDLFGVRLVLARQAFEKIDCFDSPLGNNNNTLLRSNPFLRMLLLLLQFHIHNTCFLSFHNTHSSSNHSSQNSRRGSLIFHSNHPHNCTAHQAPILLRIHSIQPAYHSTLTHNRQGIREEGHMRLQPHNNRVSRLQDHRVPPQLKIIDSSQDLFCFEPVAHTEYTLNTHSCGYRCPQDQEQGFAHSSRWSYLALGLPIQTIESLRSVVIQPMADKRYVFVVQWYDSAASLVHSSNLIFFVIDNTIQMYDIKNKKLSEPLPADWLNQGPKGKFFEVEDPA